MTPVRAAQVLVLGSLIWGTLAFGATYEWASRPMAIAAAAASIACLVGGWRSPGPGTWLGLMMVVLLCAIGVQLVPLPQATLIELSPARHALLRQLYVAYRFNPALTHPLSIAPPMTLWALLFCAVSFAWIVGLSKLLTVTGATWLASGLTILGVVIALVGIVQNAVYDGRLYGFWTPENQYAGPFGPFINKNHFAGWMLMVLPLAFGLFKARAERATHGVSATWRDRALWLSSERANRLLLLAGAIGVMTLALLLTLSRSGILAFLLALMLSLGLGLMRGGSRRRTLAFALTPLILVALMLIWVGPDIVERFRTSGLDDLRVAAWADAIDIGRRFPVAGTGLNTYGTATLVLQTRLKYVHFAQAHNDYLQLWVEGGVLLAIPALLLAIAVMTQVVARSRLQPGMDWLRGGAVAGMIAVLAQECVDFSLQMPANFLLFATLCAVAVHVSPVVPIAGSGRSPSAGEQRGRSRASSPVMRQ